MTLALDLDKARRDKTATLALLRSAPDCLELLRSGFHHDSETHAPIPTCWALWTRAIDDGPCLKVGIHGNKGTLTWWADGGNEKFVPASTQLRGDVVEYWFASGTLDYTEGEELPVEYVYAALGEFVATGQRPKIIQWIPATDVPDLRDVSSTSPDPVIQAWEDVLPSDGA